MLDFDFDPNRPAWSKQLAVFDLETTGLDLDTSRIVTAAVAVIDSNGEPTEVHEWLVNPGIEIPEAAANVHGITTDMARANGVQPGMFGPNARIIQPRRYGVRVGDLPMRVLQQVGSIAMQNARRAGGQ